MVHIWDATGSFGLRGTIDHSLGSVYSLAVTRQFIIVGRFFTLLTVTYATPWIKVKVAYQADPHFHFLCSMKRPGVFLLPPGWDASPLRGYPMFEAQWAHG